MPIGLRPNAGKHILGPPSAMAKLSISRSRRSEPLYSHIGRLGYQGPQAPNNAAASFSSAAVRRSSPSFCSNPNFSYS
jgi:hypothetical protein